MLLHSYVIYTFGVKFLKQKYGNYITDTVLTPTPLQFRIWSVTKSHDVEYSIHLKVNTFLFLSLAKSKHAKINSEMWWAWKGSFCLFFAVTEVTLFWESSLDLALLHRQTSLKWSWSFDPLRREDCNCMHVMTRPRHSDTDTHTHRYLRELHMSFYYS